MQLHGVFALHHDHINCLQMWYPRISDAVDRHSALLISFYIMLWIFRGLAVTYECVWISTQLFFTGTSHVHWHQVSPMNDSNIYNYCIYFPDRYLIRTLSLPSPGPFHSLWKARHITQNHSWSTLHLQTSSIPCNGLLIHILLSWWCTKKPLILLCAQLLPSIVCTPTATRFCLAPEPNNSCRFQQNCTSAIITNSRGRVTKGRCKYGKKVESSLAFPCSLPVTEYC